MASPDETGGNKMVIAVAAMAAGLVAQKGFELTWRLGLEPRAIAARLGLSDEVVRARKSRGLKRVVAYVQKRLKSDGYDVEVNVDETGGVAYAEVHFRTLTKKATTS